MHYFSHISRRGVDPDRLSVFLDHDGRMYFRDSPSVLTAEMRILDVQTWPDFEARAREIAHDLPGCSSEDLEAWLDTHGNRLSLPA